MTTEGATGVATQAAEESHTVMARLVTKSIKNSEPLTRNSTVTSAAVLSMHEERAFRAAYETLVERCDAKEKLVGVPKTLEQATLQNQEQAGGEDLTIAPASYSLRIQTDEEPSRLLSFEKEQSAVAIGRYTFNEVSLKALETSEKSHQALSRVHAIILLLPRLGRLLICDVGSQTGLRIIERSGNDPVGGAICTSRPGQRRSIFVSMEETVVLQLGQDAKSRKLTLNPKECIICMETPRQISFSCGHFVCCRSCAEQIQERNGRCPTCRAQLARAPLGRAQAAKTHQGAHTMMVQKANRGI